jgi:hypothetical protein
MSTLWRLQQPEQSSVGSVDACIRRGADGVEAFFNGQRVASANDAVELLASEPRLGTVDLRYDVTIRTDLPASVWVPMLGVLPDYPEPFRTQAERWPRLAAAGYGEDDDRDEWAEDGALPPLGRRWTCNGTPLRLAADGLGRPKLLPWPEDGPPVAAAISWVCTGSRVSGYDWVTVLRVAPGLLFAVTNLDDEPQPTATDLVIGTEAETGPEAAARLAVTRLLACFGGLTGFSGTDEITLCVSEGLADTIVDSIVEMLPVTPAQLTADPQTSDRWVRIGVERIVEEQTQERLSR